MKIYFKFILVITLVTTFATLATPQAAWAGGMQRPRAQADMAELEGYVWNDMDRDGVQDAEESGIPDLAVNLYDTSDVLAGATVTDEKGMYLFSNLAPGEYYVEFMPPAGFFLSPRDQGKDDKLDSDANSSTGKTSLIRLAAGKNSRIWDAGIYPLPGVSPQHRRGTVKPPPPVIRTCKNGSFSVGGISAIKVTNLEKGYCLLAFLWNHRFPFGKPPSGGQFLANITFLQIFRYGRLVHDLPPEDGEVEVCYAAPPGKEAQIYFFDFHRGRSKGEWKPLETTVTNGVICAPAQTTGAYALIGK